MTNLAPWTMPTGLGAFFNSNGSVAALLVALFNLGVATRSTCRLWCCRIKRRPLSSRKRAKKTSLTH
nr:PTS system N,N'-diacetylchitobiose-specific EIIC component [Klebsiella pneumoniae]